ncbi:MAG: hypothetical protein QW727_04335 [Candidatus Pacearchaeota archaeon]
MTCAYIFKGQRFISVSSMLSVAYFSKENIKINKYILMNILYILYNADLLKFKSDFKFKKSTKVIHSKYIEYMIDDMINKNFITYENGTLKLELNENGVMAILNILPIRNKFDYLNKLTSVLKILKRLDYNEIVCLAKFMMYSFDWKVPNSIRTYCSFTDEEIEKNKKLCEEIMESISIYIPEQPTFNIVISKNSGGIFYEILKIWYRIKLSTTNFIINLIKNLKITKYNSKKIENKNEK